MQAQAGAANAHKTLDGHAPDGGLAPDRIRRILADLIPALADLHRTGGVHGDISLSTIGLDESGRARLLSPPLAPAANAEYALLREGYAAFEQYTDDPDTPCGPWTDIYALAATACALLTGTPPPPALARCVRDDYVPLAQRCRPGDEAFCAALDQGLAMDPHARPQTIDGFAHMLDLDVVPAAMAMATGPATETERAPAATAPAPAAEAGAATASWAAKSNSAPAPAPAPQNPAAAPASPRPDPEPDIVSRTTRGVEHHTAVLSAAHASNDRDGRETASAPVPPDRQRPAQQRAPWLMVLAIIVAIAATVYVWLRPQPARQADIVARAADSASDKAAASPVAGTIDSPPKEAAGTASFGTDARGTAPRDIAVEGATAPPSTTSAPPATDATGHGSPPATPAPGSATHTAALHSSGAGPSSPPSGAAPAAGTLSADTTSAPGVSSPATSAQVASSAVTSAPATARAATASQNPGAGPAALPAASAGTKPAPDDRSKAAVAPPQAGKTPVTVSVSIRPWGEVFVNGRSHGVSPPLNRLTLPPGKYAITVRNNAGPDYHQTLVVTAGRSAAISHTFE
jgi:hypothetical protein